jgi:hypothetical protein
VPLLIQGKTNWKYILIVLILAAIVGGGILSYLRYFKREISSLSKFPEIKKPEKIETEKPKIEEETADWKTYESLKMGFSIKYPSRWEIFGKEETIHEGAEGESVKTEFFYTDDQERFSGIVIIKGPGYPEELILEKIANEYKNEILSEEFPDRKDEKEEILIVAGVPSIKFCGFTKEEEQYCDVVVPTKEKIFNLKCFSETEECTSTFNLMLSTFTLY